MKRRAFLSAGFAIAFGQARPVRAQGAAGRQRRLALFMNTLEKDSLGQARKDALLRGLKELGWIQGTNLHIDYRWVGNDVGRYRQHADEVVALRPEIIVVGGGTSIVRPLQQATTTIPIVFATATDPVGGGLVASLARPGGNITGLMQREFGLGTKSLELLKQLAPRVRRVAVFRDPASTGGVGQFAAIQAAAPSLGVEVTPLDVRTATDIERGMAEFARAPNGGVIVTSSSSAGVHRKLLVKLANQHRLPAVYSTGAYVADGGLAAYGVDLSDNYRRAAAYVDRILKGEKPAEMPVQHPTKFEIVLNLKTARAIGLQIPQPVLLRADKIIE
jgi:putative ABC transport system substrate-binding protein